MTSEPDWGRASTTIAIALVLVLNWLQFPQLPPLVVQGLPIAFAVLGVLMAPPGSISRARLSMSGLALVVWMAMTLGWSNDPALTIFFLRAWPVLPLVLLLAAAYPPRVTVTAITAVVAGLMAVTALWFAVAPGSASRPPIGDVAIGLRGPFPHKSTFGLFAAVALAFLLASRLRPALKSVAAVVVVVLLVFSESATGMSTALVVAGVWLLVRSLAAARDSRSRTLGGTAAIGLLVAGVYAAFASLPLITASFGKDVTFTGRTDIWAASVRAIAERPWFGYGWAGVWFEPSIDPTATMNRQIGFEASHAHNAALQLLLEFGAVGLALWLLLLVLLVRTGWRLSRRSEPLGMLLVLYGTVLGFAGLSEVTTGIPMLTIELALVAAGISRLATLERAERSAVVHAPAGESDERAGAPRDLGETPERAGAP